MRKKTDKKRQSILDAAYELFRNNGFEKTSMAEINAKAGCSKPTLYSYFSSKEELFVDCMFELAKHFLEDMFFSLQDPKLDLRTALSVLGENTLRVICTPEMLAARCLIIAEAERSGIGRLFYERLTSRLDEIRIYLSKAMDDGKLRNDDPLLATTYFRALLEAEVYEPCLLAASKTPPDNEMIKTAVDRVVSTFLRAYAPD